MSPRSRLLLMEQRTIRPFREAIQRLHGCESTYIKSVPVHETFEGQTVWEGVVHVFRLERHPTASWAYAWAELLNDVTGKQRFVAVLHEGPVHSPETAVQASIVQGHRRG
jgi:hypothetical protein